MKNYFRYVVVSLTALLVGGAWWATQNGVSLPRFQSFKENRITDCPNWQRDIYGNCPPKSHRISIGSREYQDNNGK